MKVIKRIWINHCVAEICEVSPNEALSIFIHGTEDPEQYKKIKEYLWAEGIMDETMQSYLGISLDSSQNS